MKSIRQLEMQTYLKTLASLFLIVLIVGGCTPSSHPLGIKVDNEQTADTQGGTAPGVIPKGTKVDDLDLGGTHVHEAPQKIESWAKDKLEETRVLLYNEIEVPVTLKDIGFELDTEKILAETLHSPGQALPSVLKVDALKVSQALEEKLTQFNRPAKDASYKIEKDKVVITPAENGSKVAVDQMLSGLQNIPLSKIPEQIDIITTEVPARVTTESLQTLAFDTVIGEFTTKFRANEVNRSANLRAAAKALDRKILRPGETFSFNDTVGPRVAGTGYKEAYVIVNGEYVQGTGGGVCQVSSTLYNAVLLGNLEVVERVPHAITVSYVPTGQDATVNYPNIDFKFKNNTTSLLYIRSETKSDRLTLRIWGKRSDKSVRIERAVEKVINYKTEKRLDPKLSSGRVVQDQSGSKGIVVNTWKVIRDGSGQETKLFLSRDSYAPTKRILRVGTRGVSEM